MKRVFSWCWVFGVTVLAVILLTLFNSRTHIPRTMEISVVNARESEDSKALREMMEAAWHEANDAETYPSLLYWLHSFEFFEEILLFFEQVCCETLARYTKQCQAQWYILWQMRSYVGGFLPAKSQIKRRFMADCHYKLFILSKNTKCTYQSELSCKLHHWGLENYSTGDGGHMQKADSCQLSKATRVSSKNLTDLIFNIFKDVPPLKILQMIQISLSTCRFHLFSMCRFRRVSCCGILMASWSLSAIPDRFSSTVSEGVRGRGTCETNLSYFQIFQVLGGRLFYLVLKRFQSLFF